MLQRCLLVLFLMLAAPVHVCASERGYLALVFEHESQLGTNAETYVFDGPGLVLHQPIADGLYVRLSVKQQMSRYFKDEGAWRGNIEVGVAFWQW